MISVMDILEKAPFNYKRIRNSVYVDEKIESKSKVQKGDLVFVRSSEIPKEVGWSKAYLEDRYALFSGFSIRGKKKAIFNSHFIELSLNYINRKQIESKAGGSTRFNVSQTILKNITVLTPNIDEQNTIDRLTNKLDSLICLYQKKLNLYEGIKKYMLQNVFPSDAEKVPNVRFADFNGDWEQYKLENLTSERNERSGKGELLSVTISNGVVKTSSLQRKNNSSKDMSNYKLVQKNDIVYNSMRMWQGASGVSQYSGIVSPAYTVIHVNPRLLDTEFLGYVIKLNRMTWEFRIHSQGLTSDTWNLKYPLFSQISIKIPSLKEQKKISNQLKLLDKSINDTKKQLETRSHLKKFLLQTLFI